MVELDVPYSSPSKLPSRLSSIRAPMDSAPSSSTPHPIRWRKGELIGAGAFGRVYMGMNLDSGELLAVKQVGFLSFEMFQIQIKCRFSLRSLNSYLKILLGSHPSFSKQEGEYQGSWSFCYWDLAQAICWVPRNVGIWMWRRAHGGVKWTTLGRECIFTGIKLPTL